MKVYLAGPLFTEAEQVQRRKEGAILKERFPQLDLYNPVDAPFNLKKEELPSAQVIFDGDYKELAESDILIADISDEDSGTIMEIGLAIEQNKKIIIGINSDMRLATANKYPYPSKGLNHFVLGGLEKYGYFVTSFEEAMDTLEKALATLQ